RVDDDRLPHAERAARREMLDRHALHCVLVALPVAVLGRHGRRELVAALLTRKLLLEARHDVVVAVHIDDGAALFRALAERARIVAQLVVERDDAVVADGHGIASHGLLCVWGGSFSSP